MDKILERLINEFPGEEARYAYADSVTNAFLTAQIKSLRDDRGMTQEKLAELVGTKQSGISRWQNGGYSSCKVESLRKFAKAFGVRLRIRFEEFGTLPDEVKGFDEKNLTPRKFEDDPAFKEEVAASGTNQAKATTGVDVYERALREFYRMYPYAVSGNRAGSDLSWLGNSSDAASKAIDAYTKQGRMDYLESSHQGSAGILTKEPVDALSISVSDSVVATEAVSVALTDASKISNTELGRPSFALIHGGGRSKRHIKHQHAKTKSRRLGIVRKRRKAA